MTFLRRNWAAVTLWLVPLAVLWPCVFLGKHIGSWDSIMHMAPWNSTGPVNPWDVLQADGVLQFYPWRDLVFRSWAAGQLPLWNGQQLCGTPLLANSQSGGFYPLHIVSGVLLYGAAHLSTGTIITLLAWFHLAWAALGARRLALLNGANEVGGFIAAVAYGMSAFMVAWTPLASVVTTCSWIPWCLVGVHRLPDRRLGALVLAGSVGMMLLGGHLQFAAYGLIASVVYAALRLGVSKARPASWALAGASVVVGFCLASAQVLPSVAFSKTSHRQVGPTAEGAAAYQAGALGTLELTGIAVPALTGTPASRCSGLSAVITTGTWPAFVKRGAAFAEGAIGIGALPFLLLFLIRRSRLRSLSPLLATAIVGLLLAVGPLSLALYWAVPGWSATGSPGRASVLVVLALSILAGAAVPNRIARPHALRLGLGALLAAGLSSLFFCMGAAQRSWANGGTTGWNVVDFTRPSPLTAWVVPALLAAAALYALARKWTWFAAVCAAASIFSSGSIDCLQTGWNKLEPSKPIEAERTAFVNRDWGLLIPSRAVMPGNLASVSGHRDVAGYDSLLNRNTLEFLRKVNAGKDPAPPANGNMMMVKPGFDAAALRDAAVNRVFARDHPGRLTETAIPDPVSRATLGSGTARITEDGFDRQTVETDGSGPLVVRDRNMEGWKAWVDGSPAQIEPGLWRQVNVPAGRHTVSFRYEPPGLQVGLLLSGLGVASWILLLVTGGTRTKGSRESKSDQ